MHAREEGEGRELGGDVEIGEEDGEGGGGGAGPHNFSRFAEVPGHRHVPADRRCLRGLRRLAGLHHAGRIRSWRSLSSRLHQFNNNCPSTMLKKKSNKGFFEKDLRFTQKCCMKVDFKKR